MQDKGKYYITTAIAYTSGKPHIGNSYEIVLADCIARYNVASDKTKAVQQEFDELVKSNEFKRQELSLALSRKQELINKAREEQKKDEKFHIVIRADENVQYKAVIGLLDSFKKAGVSRVGLATEKDTKK